MKTVKQITNEYNKAKNSGEDKNVAYALYTNDLYLLALELEKNSKIIKLISRWAFKQGDKYFIQIGNDFYLYTSKEMYEHIKEVANNNFEEEEE